MDPIASFSGIASGIQWRDMVDQIMQAERARRVNPLLRQQDSIASRNAAWSQYQSLVGKLTGAARALQDGSAFARFRVTAGTTPAGRSLFTATTSADASPGSYAVQVEQLARAEKLATAGSFSSTSEPLGASGSFWINGKRVDLTEADTLASIRDRINAQNRGANPSGVTATLLGTGPNEHRLVLTSTTTGDRGIELVDGDGSPLQALGITSGGTSTNLGANGAAQTQRFESRASSIAAMLGLTSPPEMRDVQIAGVTVTVNLAEDSLEKLQQKIQAAIDARDADDPYPPGTKPQARLVQETVGGRTMHRLEVTGEPPVVDGDTRETLALLGFARADRTAGAQLVTGADARLKIDSIEITRRSNTIAGVVPGVTIDLLAAEPGVELNLSVARDLDAVTAAVKAFATAYNDVRAFVDRQAAPDQPLAANGTLRTTLGQLTQVLFSDVAGLDVANPYTRGALVGVALSRHGTLEVDEAALRAALTTNLQDVRALFGRGGVANDARLEYVSAGARTQPGAYPVTVTALATRASTASTPFAAYDASGGDGTTDQLTVFDRSSGRTIHLDVAHGATLDEVVVALNARFADDRLRLQAAADDGALRISATDWGSPGGFTLSGDAAERLGLTTNSVSGTDVEGTIGGEPATGRGRALTGATGTAVEGLVVRFTGATLPDPATQLQVRFALGIGGMMSQAADRIARAGDGTIATQIDSLDASQSSLSRRIDEAEARLEQRRDAMIRQFARMEEALSRVQAQGNWLAQQIQAMQPRPQR